MSLHKISFVFAFIICILSCPDFSYGQAKPANAKPKDKPASVSKSQLEIDSLNGVIEDLNNSYQHALSINKEKDTIIDALNEKIIRTQRLNDELEKKLAGFKGDNLKLDQSNRILIIFNAVVGLLLLTTLIWFLRNLGRKKAPDKSKAPTARDISAPLNVKSQPGLTRDQQYFDNILEQLEKLGQLRASGVLNEEEFNRQKQQILGNG